MAPSQQGQGESGGYGPLWVIAAVFTALIVIWYAFKTEIVAGFLLIKQYELYAVSLVTDSVNPMIRSLQNANPADIGIGTLAVIAQGVGEYLAIPVGLCLAVFAYLLHRKNITSRFCQIYDMEKLLKEENVNWPNISPIMDQDMYTKSVEEGPWSMAQRPMDFAKKNGLIKEIKKPPSPDSLSKDNHVEAQLIRTEATQVFVRQLGKRWEGIDALNMPTKALFAAFAARLHEDIDEARDLLAQISWSSRKGKLDFKGVDEMIRKYRYHDVVEKVTNEHAFVLTVMGSMLESTRTLGVLASADFLWLKPLDRRLWFMLNSVGRQVPFVEAAGPYAHWIYEKHLGKRVVTPMVKEAVNALEDSMNDTIYIPDSK